MRYSKSLLLNLKRFENERERSCRHVGTEFTVLEVHFIPETVFGLMEAP